MKSPCCLPWFSLPVWFGVVLLVLLPRVVFAQPNATEKLQPVTLQINWNHQFQFAGFYAAIQQGYYQEAGLDVTVKGWKSGIKVLDEVVSGRAEFAVGYGTLMSDYAKGAPISLVMASFQFSPMVLLSHEPIHYLSELSGKSVMHYGNLQIHGLLNKAKGLVEKPIKPLNSSGDLNDFIDKKVDFYAAYYTNEPYRLEQLGIPYYTLDPKSYGVQSYGDFVITSKKLAQLEPDMVQKFKEASIRGWKYAIHHQQEVVDFIIEQYPVVKSREALLAEAKVTTRYVQSGEVPIGMVESSKLMATAAGAKEVGLMTQEEYDRLDMQDFMFHEKRSLFTQKELQYLANNKVIRLANDTNWEPFEFIDDKGRYRGIAAEYFHLFEKKLGIRFEVVKNKTWPEVVEMTKQGQLDVYSCAVATKERQEYMEFTEPYLSFPMVLAADGDVGFIERYEQLSGQTIAVVDGYWSHEYLQRQYPKIQLLVVKSVKEGLDAVIDGRASAYSGNLAAINFAIRKYGMEGIRIVGQLEERFELALGVQKDNPILFSIMQKALNSVTEKERQAIFDNWIRLQVVNKMDQRQLMEILVPAGLIIFGLLVLVLIYSYQKRQQKGYICQIHELSYATEVDLNTQTIVWSSDSFAKLSGYSKQELQGMSYFKPVCDSLSEDVINYIKSLLQAGKTWHGEVEGRKKSGHSYWVDLTLTPKKDLFGNVKRVIATRVDISDRKKVEKLSITDVLTGLYNRRYFNDMIELELKRTQRENLPFSLAMIDIDYFKGVNDYYGHPHGDVILQQVASQIKLAFSRSHDYVFRVGGEEFMVMAYFESRQQCFEHLQAMSEQVEALQLENLASPYGVVTISTGAIFLENGHSLDSEEILQSVDKLLYQAKSAGRNQVVITQPGEHEV